MRFELEPGAAAELRRLGRWIRALKWVVGVAVFVPLADFLGGVDLVDLLRGEGWLPATVLSLLFAFGISFGIAFTFGVVAEWVCRHRIDRAHRSASAERIERTAAAVTQGRERAPGPASAPVSGPPSSPSRPRHG